MGQCNGRDSVVLQQVTPKVEANGVVLHQANGPVSTTTAPCVTRCYFPFPVRLTWCCVSLPVCM